MVDQTQFSEPRPSIVGGAARGMFNGAFKGGLVGGAAAAVGVAALIGGTVLAFGAVSSMGAVPAIALTAAAVGTAAVVGIGSAVGSVGGAIAGIFRGDPKDHDGLAQAEARQHSTAVELSMQQAQAAKQIERMARISQLPVAPTQTITTTTVETAAPRSHVDALVAAGHQPRIEGISHAAAVNAQQQAAAEPQRGA